MKPIPTAPTDNLYKFVAIIGFWMFFGLIALVGWVVYLQYEIKDNAIESRAYFRSVGALREIEARLEAIESGRIDENKLEWVPEAWDLDQEKHFLNIAEENHSQSIAENQHAADSNVGEDLRYLKHPVVIAFGLLYALTMSFCLLIGFKRWKQKIHDPELYFNKKNTELLERSIEKLDLEIYALRKELQDGPNN